MYIPLGIRRECDQCTRKIRWWHRSYSETLAFGKVSIEYHFHSRMCADVFYHKWKRGLEIMRLRAIKERTAS